MRSKTISSLKAIARNLKNTKDPNPLQTTLVTMSTKFPLSIDMELSSKYNVPRELLDPTRLDTHQHGKILARKEVVDW